MAETTTTQQAPRRLPAGARQAQLIQVALDFMRRRPFTALSAEAVAAEAGVSKGLVFHYFPTTVDLHLAVLERSTDELVSRLDLNPEVAPADRLRVGIDTFIDYAIEYADSYLHLARGGATDPRIHQRLDQTRDRVAHLIGAAIGFTEPPPALLLVLRGYVALIEETVLEWLVDRPVPRPDLVDFLCEAAEKLIPAAVQLVTSADDDQSSGT